MTVCRIACQQRVAGCRDNPAAHLRSWSLWEPCSHSISSLRELPRRAPSGTMATELSPLVLDASGEDGCTTQERSQAHDGFQHGLFHAPGNVIRGEQSKGGTSPEQLGV